MLCGGNSFQGRKHADAAVLRNEYKRFVHEEQAEILSEAKQNNAGNFRCRGAGCSDRYISRKSLLLFKFAGKVKNYAGKVKNRRDNIDSRFFFFFYIKKQTIKRNRL